MNILSSDNGVFEARSIYKIDNEGDSGKNNGTNKRRKTACEREAIFNRLILNNPSILSVDTTLLPGTCVYCNICQVRIILNPAYYLNNWRTHMNGKLHKALSKAVGSPQFIDEIDFFQEKDDSSYFDIRNDTGVSVAAIGLDNYDNITNVVSFSVEDNLKNENFNCTNGSCIDGSSVLNKEVKIVEVEDGEKDKGDSLKSDVNAGYVGYQVSLKNKMKHLFGEAGVKEKNLSGYKLEGNTEALVYEEVVSVCNKVTDNFECNLSESDTKKRSIDPTESNNSDKANDQGTLVNQNYVIHPIISSISINNKDNEIESGSFVANMGDYDNILFRGKLDEKMGKFEKEDDYGEEKANEEDKSKVEESTETTLRNSNFQLQFKNSNISAASSPFLVVNFEKNGFFRCPGINKVRYWAMCFIGSERSSEPNDNINYNDTRRVFYKQSIITKVIPNNEPEHQGVVHHPNCLEVVSKPNQPCERCSLYINNRQLARVISKRATRLQEMWDRVVAGESILNGGSVPQSIVSAYNHRIDHWSRCNDPLEAITRALAGCRQRDYTNFFWKIRENLLQNSRLIKNHL
ncbi:hypothetical protein FG386_002370 [Cryptosporidium ryanae]|uniref:uncharacterized protein n=1 Tax=Cryptosporidium ryanae TaxID=515981 RepID=UPI003519E22B|nr:hypothetical protein FG386_002370 [Cryptosporidium ryanae]